MWVFYIGTVRDESRLALDLMEEMRAVIVDRFVLTMINNRQLKEEHFRISENGAIEFTNEGKKKFIIAWQEHKREQITHPYLQEKICWGLVLHVQALLLARYLRGDLDGYPPFCGMRDGMLVLITYDVNTEDVSGKARLRKVAKQCVNHGQRVQNSVFECILDSGQCKSLKAQLLKIIDQNKDSLRFYYLGNHYEIRLSIMGQRNI